MDTGLKLFLYFLGSFGFTLLMVYILLGFAQSLGIRSKNDVHVRWSNTAKPSLGGIAIFISVFLAVVVYSISHPGENIFSEPKFVFFFIGSCLAFFMGLADDAFNTRPLLKLSTQIMCGILLVLADTMIPISGNYILDGFLTIIWVVGLMNSLNMLDNMDGITASITITILLILMAFCLIFCCLVYDIHSFIVIGLLGSLSGFLWVNRPPSKLFMGDSGSQLVGFAIAFYTVHFIWQFEHHSPLPIWVKTYVLMMILAIPFIDTFTVVFNRIRSKQSPAKGGKDHTTHHMVYAGHSEKQTWLFYWITALILGAQGLLILYLYMIGFGYFSILPFPSFLLVFYYLFRNTHVHPIPKHENPSGD